MVARFDKVLGLQTWGRYGLRMGHMCPMDRAQCKVIQHEFGMSLDKVKLLLGGENVTTRVVD